MRFLWILLFIAASCNVKKSCHVEEVKTLFTEQGMHVGVDTAYSHWIYVKGVYKECLDSAMALAICNGYLDTVTHFLPIDNIRIFNSERGFKYGVPDLYPEEIEKDCLVSIWFKQKNHSPESFIFYNEDGEIGYDDTVWKKYH